MKRITVVLLLVGVAVAQRADAAEAQVFVPYVYVDPVSGLEAFRCLVPKGWKVEGGITWSANPALPAQSRFRFFDPQSQDELNLFPTQAYFWTDNRLFLATNPPGTLRFNTLVAQPIDLDAAFSRIILPSARGQVPRITFVSRKNVPELAALARGEPTRGVNTSADAGKVRVRYVEGGQALEEEFYAAVANFVIPLPGYFIDYWYVDYVFSARAAQGKLDARTRLFQTMIHSMRVNPKWFAKVANTREALVAQMTQQIKTIGSIGSAVARASSTLREDQQRDWERRQAVQDQVAQAQSDTIRGIDRFTDPHSGNEVELPSGYGLAWANNRGEYIVTDSPGLNPNIGSNLHWEPMPVAK